MNYPCLGFVRAYFLEELISGGLRLIYGLSPLVAYAVAVYTIHPYKYL